MRSADSLSPSQRARLSRIHLQTAVDEYVEGPQRQEMAEQFARDERSRRRSHWRSKLRRVAIPVLVTLFLVAAVAFALLLISPTRSRISPFADAVGAPEDMRLSYPEAWLARGQAETAMLHAEASAPKAVNGAWRACPGTDRASISLCARDVAAAHDIPPGLLVAQVHIESSFNPRAVGRAGEKGLMQLSPAVAKRWGVRDPYDPIQNLLAGARELRSHYGPGGWTAALVRYNGRGPMARAYAQRVLRAWEAGE